MITNLHDIETRRIGYTVSDIATPTAELVCWDLGSDPNDTIRQATEKDITYVPVTQQGRIPGIIALEALRQGNKYFEPLMSEQFISHDTPILHILELFAQRKDGIFFVLNSNDITGLVAPADLNRVPARASIYLLIAHFETYLIELISKKLGKEEEHIGSFLQHEQLRQLRRWQKTATDKGVELSLLHYAGLRELTTIVSKVKSLHEEFADTWMVIEKNIDDLIDIRNAVAHPGNQLVGSRYSLESIDDNIQAIIDVIIGIQPLLNPPPADPSVAHKGR